MQVPAIGPGEHQLSQPDGPAAPIGQGAIAPGIAELPARRVQRQPVRRERPERGRIEADIDTLNAAARSMLAADGTQGVGDQVRLPGSSRGFQGGTLEVLEAPGGLGSGRRGTDTAMIEHTPRQVAVKVSPEGDKLITSGAHYLHMSKKDLVEAAVAFYLDARREEMQAGMRELLSELDGSRASRVAMLAGMTRAELDAVGGVDEDD
ncbi:hypothetical protein [Pseudofrankia sp. BMG5.37]|uniref:hypothetical protein n=1 Tax=Pseudofrankia sp. BMG5.37 TaxID=3050035 RepID=UPI002895C166|nr:hypothetical protein [Pseudofrankia sp. BMG5.37]MDT3443590.1 hypothetical protein [Pseudofrankia sp. BMG5.37]